MRGLRGLRRLVRLRREVGALRREAELKDSFIALASHELRAPAAVIYGFTETLAHRGGELPRDDLAELHAVLHQQSLRLNRVIDQVLDLSRLDAGVASREPERLPVRARLVDVVDTVAGEHADEVEVKVREDLDVVADPTAFERIVSNLVTNAIRHGRTHVEIRADTDERHFRLTVQDDGDGVPEELVPFLFQRFARGKHAAGSGLGLSIAQSYAQANGGKILYEAGRGGGARFQLILPARAA
jgi:signal transduction histidine kinase